MTDFITTPDAPIDPPDQPACCISGDCDECVLLFWQCTGLDSGPTPFSKPLEEKP